MAEPLNKMTQVIQETREPSETLQTNLKFNQNNAVLGGVRGLPLDILSHIMTIHLTSAEECTANSPTGRLAPLMVCRKWRDAARASPSCWTRIIVDTDRARPEILEKRMAAQLKLAGILPMQLIINRSLRHAFPSNVDQIIRSFLQQQTARIESYADIYFGFSYGSLGAFTKPTFLGTTYPNLTHLYFYEATDTPDELDQCRFPALKHLHVGRISSKRLLHLSANCPALVSLIFEDFRRSYQGIEPALLQATIPEDHPLVSFENLPSLERLVMPQDILETEFKPSWEEIINGSKVKTLTLYGNFASLHGDRTTYLPEICFDYLFLCFPCLEHLILSNTTVALLPTHLEWQAERDRIQRITFEGFIRCSPVRMALRMLPKLRHINFDLSQSSLVPAAKVVEHFGASSIFDDSPASGRKGPVGWEAEKELIEYGIADLLSHQTEESTASTGSRFTYCAELERIEFSGFPITRSDTKTLLDLLRVRDLSQDGETKCAAALRLSLRNCNYYVLKAVPGVGSIGYSEAEQLFETIAFEDL